MASSSPQTPQTRLQRSLICSRQILLSGLDEREKRELAGKIEELGGVCLQSETFKPSCTHLICGRLSRSEKFLCACAMGRWILHPSYIIASAKEGEWLTEEDYEWVNFSEGAEKEMGVAARRWRFHVEAFMSFPFSGWKVAVIVRGARKSSIYTRLLSSGGADIYKLTLPVGNKSRVANLLTYVFVGEHNVSEAQHLIEYGILCLRPEFIGDYILQDPPPDPLDYLVKAYSPSSPKNGCPVDINDSLVDIKFSQTTSVGSVCSSPQQLTPTTSQGSPCVRTRYQMLPYSPLVRTDLPRRATTENGLPQGIVPVDKGKKRKMMEDLDSVVQQIKRSKTVHRGDLWQPSMFTGVSTEHSQSREISGPFSDHLEGMILASLEDGDSEFFLSGLDMVVSSVTDRQFPTPRIMQIIRNKLLQAAQSELIQYRCFNVLMKVLILHPPIRPAVSELYLSLCKDSEETMQGSVIRSLTHMLMEENDLVVLRGYILLLRCIVASLEVNLQHYLDRLCFKDNKLAQASLSCGTVAQMRNAAHGPLVFLKVGKGEVEVRKLRCCLFAQMIWPGNMYISVNSLCREILELFRLCLTGDIDRPSKRELVKLSTSLICMAVLVSHYIESGHRVRLQEPISPSLTALSLLHETVRHIPSVLSVDTLRAILRSLTPPWVAVHFCCLLLRNLDDYLLLQELPAEYVKLKEIVTKYFFLLPKIESRQSNFHQSPHLKKSVLRSGEETTCRTRGKRLLKDKENEQFDHNLNCVNVKEVNKRNVKGETPLQVACIKNNLKKVRQLLKVPGIDVNTRDNAGWSPLHEACNLGHLEIVRELLNFVPARTMDHFLGQVGDKKCKKVNLLAATEDLITPLHDAVMNNHIDICKLLLQHGGAALLESRTAVNQTPLDLAVTSQMKELLLSFTEGHSSRSCSQGSVSSDSSTESPPSEYLYDQVVGGEDQGFADREECCKYISLITTLLHAYLRVMDYHRVQSLLEEQSENQSKDVENSRNVTHDGTEISPHKCQIRDMKDSELTCTEPLNFTLRRTQFQQDFRTAGKLSVYVQRFVRHIHRITRQQDFDLLTHELSMLQQLANLCQGSVS